MEKWGKTVAGKQRYRCAKCKTTGIRSRPDNPIRVTQQIFVNWLTGSDRLEAIAKRLEVTIRTLNNRFKNYWDYLPRPLPIKNYFKILVVDGVTVVKHNLVVLVVQCPIKCQPVYWSFTIRECYESWILIFNILKAQGVYPIFVVSDGQKGLFKALSEVWPKVILQRCIIHVVRQARLWLTQRPKTEAGQELLLLVKDILQIRTRRQKRRWIRRYNKWLKKHDAFLKERSYHPVKIKRWWYTHRKLRATRSLLSNSLKYLFTFVRYPEVPRTSNHVEGGINSRLKDLLRIHRGLSAKRQKVLAAWYLAARQGQKPTRNFH